MNLADYFRRCDTYFLNIHVYKEGEPKTRAGRRNIMLPEVAIEALEKHQAYQEQARIKAGARWQDRGIVFSNFYGGFFSPAHVGDLFQGLLKKAGLPHMRFHDLRHRGSNHIDSSKNTVIDGTGAFRSYHDSNNSGHIFSCLI